MSNRSSSVVRFLLPDDSEAGFGLMIDDKRILAAVEVVAEALGILVKYSNRAG